MNADWIKLQELLRLLKSLKTQSELQKIIREADRIQQIVRLIHQLRDIQKARECLDALKANPEVFHSLSGEEKEMLREAADYDEVEWAKIVRDLGGNV